VKDWSWSTACWRCSDDWGDDVLVLLRLSLSCLVSFLWVVLLFFPASMVDAECNDFLAEEPMNDRGDEDDLLLAIVVVELFQ